MVVFFATMFAPDTGIPVSDSVIVPVTVMLSCLSPNAFLSLLSIEIDEEDEIEDEDEEMA